MVMEGYDDSRFRAVVNDADLVTSDGVPLVWVLRILGVHRQQRVYGPDLTLHVCEAATEKGLPIALYGGTQDTLAEMSRNLCDRYPRLHIASALAPPFRELTPAEDETYTSQIIQSGATIVLVGLGCPKQERWMANHRGLIPAVMIGVGAAFDFHSGRVRQAPAWMQKIGLEWLFRLLMEPRRLWKRYLKHNPRFALYFLLQLLGVRRFREV
jgi:N-acetylglucosaminyldiphosphoundecaprenol N-acetyl-beta-D-mannosaminyltransferase